MSLADDTTRRQVLADYFQLTELSADMQVAVRKKLLAGTNAQLREHIDAYAKSFEECAEVHRNKRNYTAAGKLTLTAKSLEALARQLI